MEGIAHRYRGRNAFYLSDGSTIISMNVVSVVCSQVEKSHDLKQTPIRFIYTKMDFVCQELIN